jgi:hypothetical protein
MELRGLLLYRTAGRLVAKTCADSNTLAALCTAAVQYGSSATGLHAGTETVGLHALTAIGLKCALGHGYALLFPEICLSLYGSF